MLVPVIKFDIQDFQACTSESFLVADTLENQEMILSHRTTRKIEFDRMFDFQFEAEMSMPLEFISMDTWVRLIADQPELFATVAAS